MLLLAAAVPAGAGETTRAFQQGLAGYGGVGDTFVGRLDWDTPPQHTVNYGRHVHLVLSRDGGENPLLRFELASIPPHSAVTSATLWLFNTTAASVPRKVELFGVLRDWDEGNQEASPIDGPGKRGATGDNAFDFFTGEGTDVAWGARGMAPGSDFAATPVSSVQVIGPGWYGLDITPLVRAWVRSEQPNHGLVLRDATGWQDGNPDDRTFHSSQASDLALRPRLEVTFNPDTPMADAGPDQEDLTWNGGTVVLDGSRSQDRPGGDTPSLAYSWRVVQAAYGSELKGALVGRTRTARFDPDRPGEWEIELVVTNRQGYAAIDRVHLRFLQVPSSHPRIFLTPGKLTALRARAVPSNPRWAAVEDAAADDDMAARALVGVLLNQAPACSQAIAQARALAAQGRTYSTKAAEVALVYDWCHAWLSNDDRVALLAFFAAWAGEDHGDTDVSGWGNYWPRWTWSLAAAGLATWGDTPAAQGWFDEFRHQRFAGRDLPMLDLIAAGGAWPEGTVYDWIANHSRVLASRPGARPPARTCSGARPGSGSASASSCSQHWPGAADQWGIAYRPYPSLGDAERNRGSMARLGRTMGLVLTDRFRDEPVGRQLAAVLAASPSGDPASYLGVGGLPVARPGCADHPADAWVPTSRREPACCWPAPPGRRAPPTPTPRRPGSPSAAATTSPTTSTTTRTP